MIKAIFLDIDGTLVSFKTHAVSAATVMALRDVRSRGIKIFVASGRHLSTMDNVADISFDGYVTLNGGICIANSQTIYRRNIPQEDVNGLFRYINTEERFPCVFIHEHSQSMTYKNDNVSRAFAQIAYQDPPIRREAEIREKEVYQILGFFDTVQEECVMKHLPHCSTTRWCPMFADIVPVGSNKWVGITKIMEHFGFAPHEVMAFGDGGNDVEMLAAAGIGVAMDNADMKVKAVADYIAPSVDDNGVAYALNYFKHKF